MIEEPIEEGFFDGAACAVAAITLARAEAGNAGDGEAVSGALAAVTLPCAAASAADVLMGRHKIPLSRQPYEILMEFSGFANAR